MEILSISRRMRHVKHAKIDRSTPYLRLWFDGYARNAGRSSEFQEQFVPFAHKRHMSSLESCERIVLVMQRFVGGPD